MGKLNPKQVENLSEPGTHEDGDGLRLVVKASGSKSWLLRYQLAGLPPDHRAGNHSMATLFKSHSHPPIRSCIETPLPWSDQPCLPL